MALVPHAAKDSHECIPMQIGKLTENTVGFLGEGKCFSCVSGVNILEDNIMSQGHRLEVPGTYHTMHSRLLKDGADCP